MSFFLSLSLFLSLTLLLVPLSIFFFFFSAILFLRDTVERFAEFLGPSSPLHFRGIKFTSNFILCIIIFSLSLSLYIAWPRVERSKTCLLINFSQNHPVSDSENTWKIVSSSFEYFLPRCVQVILLLSLQEFSSHWQFLRSKHTGCIFLKQREYILFKKGKALLPNTYWAHLVTFSEHLCVNAFQKITFLL